MSRSFECMRWNACVHRLNLGLYIIRRNARNGVRSHVIAKGKISSTRGSEGGRNSSVGSAWACCPRCRGFDPPLGTFSGRGDFSLGVNMGSNSIPPKTPSDESINRGLVCAHMHFIARTQKILTFMS